MSAFDQLWAQCAAAFGQRRTAARARRLVLSQLTCLGRHTLTGVLCTAGRQFADWSADYRLFERARIDEELIFGVIQRAVEAELPAGRPLVMALDDSILRKKGRHVHGAGWRRDPLSPPFHVNFAWGQRVLQISAALPCGPGQARMIPVDFQHLPPAVKPPPKASPAAWAQYRQQVRQRNLSVQAVQRLVQVRERAPRARPVWTVVDGRFTNRTILQNRPAHTTVIGRIRKDAQLHARPAADPRGRGRRRVYGQRLPTPDQIRTNPAIPWQAVTVWACGKFQTCHIKTLAPVRWRTAGPQDLRLVVIAPLGYRKTKHGRLQYRNPAYLICTDPTIPLEQLLQAYLWRWDIEVNFRDEKTLLGVGQAQVRIPPAAQKVPATAVAAYSLLLLAAAHAYGPAGRPVDVPPPRWRTYPARQRASTAQLVNQLRFELWGQAIDRQNFDGFSARKQTDQKPENLPFDVQSALAYATA